MSFGSDCRLAELPILKPNHFGEKYSIECRLMGKALAIVNRGNKLYARANLR